MSGRAGPFSRRAVAWIVGLGGASLVLAFVLTGVSDRLGGPDSAGADAFSRSAVGHRALSEFLERSGVEVRIRRNPAASSPPGELWLLLEPVPVPPQPDAFDPVADVLLYRWLESSPIVIAPPKWSHSPDPMRPDHVGHVQRLPRDVALLPFDSVGELTGTPLSLVDLGQDLDARCESAWGDSYDVALTRPRALGAVDGLEPLLSCGDRVLVGAHPYPEGGAALVVVADPDLLANHGLGRAEHARFAIDLVDRLADGAVLFDETIHGHVMQGGLLAELFRFPLVLLVVHGALLAAVAVWAGAPRFGSPPPSTPPLGIGRQILIGNIAELIAVVGRTAELVPRYRRQVVRAVSRHYGLADHAGDNVEQRIREIERLRDVHPTLDAITRDWNAAAGRRRATERALNTAVNLHRWKAEMTDVD